MSTAEQSRKYRQEHPLTEEQKKRVRELNKEATRRWRERHPDRAKESAKRYQSTHKEQVNALHRAQYSRDPVKHAARKRNFKYGINQEQFDTMLQNQSGKCAICSKFLELPQIDHDHASGKTRELLCRFCNLVLGHAHDSIHILESAIMYLKKHGVSNGETSQIFTYSH